MFRKKRGFTLIELLVVVAIIALLASVVMASLNSARGKARDAQRLSDMNQIKIALELFYSEHDHYPSLPTEGVSVSGEYIGDDSGPIEVALAPYIKTIPKDPLHDGVNYYYAYDASHCIEPPGPGAMCDPGASVCSAGWASVLSFHKAETNASFRRDTCSGSDMDIVNSSYNISLEEDGA